ncbi:MAG TPA: hypothetical protein VFV34_28695, partial [Blastocatellia bacterium]|nr:hypothetical protein [Blastocatellia bacterium]
MTRGHIPINVAILGFGNVGRAFCNYLLHRDPSTDSIPVQVRALADRSGGIIVQSPEHLNSLLSHKSGGGTVKELPGETLGDSGAFIAALCDAGVKVLIESLPTNKRDGQPAL